MSIARYPTFAATSSLPSGPGFVTEQPGSEGTVAKRIRKCRPQAARSSAAPLGQAGPELLTTILEPKRLGLLHQQGRLGFEGPGRHVRVEPR